MNPSSELEAAQAELTKNPTSADNHNRLAIAYLKNGELEPAVAHISLAIELEPAQSVNYRNRGRILFALNRPQESLADYSKAIELEPEAELYASRSVVNVSLGKEAAALADLNDAYDLHPGLENQLNRASFFANIGMAADALRDMTGVIEKAPTNPDYHLTRANLAFALARFQPELYDLGYSDIEEAMRLDEGGLLQPSLLQLADLLEAALEQSPNPTVSHRLIELIRSKK